MNIEMPDSPESRIIADVAAKKEGHSSSGVTLPKADDDAPPHQPIADAIADTAQVGRERPSE